MRAYILVATSPGKTKEVKRQLEQMAVEGSRIISVDAVTGPYDLIAVVECTDLIHLGKGLTEGIQGTMGITKTLTCLAVPVS